MKTKLIHQLSDEELVRDSRVQAILRQNAYYSKLVAKMISKAPDLSEAKEILKLDDLYMYDHDIKDQDLAIRRDLSRLAHRLKLINIKDKIKL